MTNYKIQMMTKDNYIVYLSGSEYYHMEELTIPAESKEEAIATVETQYPECHINEGYVKSEEEIVEAKRIAEEARAARIAKEEIAKAKRAAREEAKATEMGMTIAEYKAYKNRQRKIAAYKNRIAELEAEIATMKAYISRYEN